MLKLSSYLSGYVTCELTGNSSERFLNLCRHRGIYLWDIHPEKDKYIFNISIKDFKRIKQIVRKSRMKVTIKKRNGFPFIILKNKKHKMFFCGIILSILILFMLSRYVWDIEISGNSFYTDTTIVKYLEELQIGIGTSKKSVDPAFIEEELRLKYNNISWVSAQIVGTKLFINLEEISPKGITSEEAGQLAYYDLIASCDGVITSMYTRSGTPLAAIGDTVSKGDILVAGYVKQYNDDETEKATKLVKADADIMAVTTYDYSESYSLDYMKKIYTGNTVNNYKLCLFGKDINIAFFKNKYQKYDTVSEVNKYRLTSNFYLPVSTESIVNQEYIEEKSRYTEAEAEAIADAELKQYIADMEALGAVIIENNVKIQISGNYCKVSGNLVFEQPIAAIFQRSEYTE